VGDGSRRGEAWGEGSSSYWVKPLAATQEGEERARVEACEAINGKLDKVARIYDLPSSPSVASIDAFAKMLAASSEADGAWADFQRLVHSHYYEMRHGPRAPEKLCCECGGVIRSPRLGVGREERCGGCV
jgi:hypothetical protein